jgi:hypothetical protein
VSDSLSIFGAGTAIDTNTGNKTAVLAPIAVGDVGLAFVVATDNVGAFAVTDDSADGLGASWTKIFDVLDNSGVSQMTALIRTAAFGSAGSPNVTSSGIGASTGGGVASYGIRGWTQYPGGASAVRQSKTAPNQPASASPITTFDNPALAGNSTLVVMAFDSTGQVMQVPAGWNGLTAPSYATPAFQFRLATLFNGSAGSSVTWGFVPAATFATGIIELAVVSPAVIAMPDISMFPKGSQ